MKIFCTFLIVNISKLIFLLVICIAKNFIWTTSKAIFSIFRFFFAPSDSRFSNSCISAKYCPILTNLAYLFSFQMMYSLNLNFKILTFMTGFMVQCHNKTVIGRPLLAGEGRETILYLQKEIYFCSLWL